MPSIPTHSPVTGAPLPAHYIHTTASHFVDQSSRVRILRGVNLCASSKFPVGKPSWVLDGFWEAVEAGDGNGFVGRPLELTKDEIISMEENDIDLSDWKVFSMLGDCAEADVHLARLRGWGFTFLRFVFTWEALEHDGPKKYDEAFIAHLILVLRKCKAHGFLVFLDPHQDIWSRFTGGSGAPYWTLFACGINPRSLTATQAALLHNEHPIPSSPDPENFPAMIWGTNYYRLASQTIFTLFFAGRDYAPKCIIDGVNIQDWLQGHFIGAVKHLAGRIKEAGGLLDECVIGWDSMNEPHGGMVGWADIRKIPSEQALKKGSTPTLAQSMRLGMGMKQEDIEWWDFGSFGPRRNGSVDIDPNGVKLWVESDVADEFGGVNGRWGWKRDEGWKLGRCIWAEHGVWEPRSDPIPTSQEEDKDIDILQPDYFFYCRQTPPGEPKEKADFMEDYFLPHIQDYYAALREHHPELIPFVQPPVFHRPPWLKDGTRDEDEIDLLKGRGCFSTHYYDGLTLMTRHWNWFNADALGVLRGKYKSPILAVKVGEKAIRKSIREQLGVFRADCAERMGDFPTVIGEIGIPMELDDGYSYGGRDGKGKGKGDYREQVKALDASLSAADGENALAVTIWTYCPDSTHKWGDGWNGEDLSLWSADDERTGGSITGRRMAQPPVHLEAPVYAARDQTQMIVQSVSDEDTDTEDCPRVPGQEIQLKEQREGDIVGYQVSSLTITYDDLVISDHHQNHSGLSSLAASTILGASTLGDPCSSRATLLPAYTPSSVSRATTNQQQQQQHPVYTLSFPAFKSAPMAFAFLTNGARAWKAFVRCQPLAIVGLPKGWEWDCQKAVFEMTVKVGPKDRSMMNTTGQPTTNDGFVEQDEPTVVYVPLLHFARDDVVKMAFGVPTLTASTSERNPPTAKAKAKAEGKTGAITAFHPPVTVALLEDVSSDSLALDPKTSSLPRGSSMKMTLTSSASMEIVGDSNLRTEERKGDDIGMDDALDLEVDVNGGKWIVEGQTLKWWYPIPSTAASALASSHPHVRPPRAASSASAPGGPKVNPDGTIEYKITIKRRGGPIDFKKLGVPENLVGLGPRVDIGDAGKRSDGPTNWLQAICCGNGCVIC